MSSDYFTTTNARNLAVKLDRIIALLEFLSTAVEALIVMQGPSPEDLKLRWQRCASDAEGKRASN